MKLFAVAKELAGRGNVEVEVPPGATIADLRRAVGDKLPALTSVLSRSLWAVDAAYADNTTILTEHSDVAMIPPVSGG